MLDQSSEPDCDAGGRIQSLAYQDDIVAISGKRSEVRFRRVESTTEMVFLVLLN